ncbi:MAG: biopolymer transport protein ExbD [Spirochaetes bacterium ADurb.Bin218]|jgi:biopolymer transport protein ExbD|nr:MAG: biopolymer transport protein ExbD [Spirochaetes bacterium ADurb.Bin218]HOK01711.1 biopolymer transporter ExbD [Spirochaetota bacterium]HPX91071.1 biopolymer transporter ExbD [Spirochaetota bacterium]
MNTEIEHRKKITVNFNIGPLIDVVFQLLLFFALTSYFVTNPGIEVSLPESEAVGDIDQDNVILYITRNNQIFCHGIVVGINDLEDFLKSSNSPKKTVILKADKTVQLEFIVMVMDRVKKSGIKELVIATKVEK